MDDFKETCIWMSYRYAIGRKSIASVTHAQDIADHIDWIPENRRDFTAFDIIREVNTRFKWYKNIHVDGFESQDNPIAITDMLFEWFIKNPQDDYVKFFMEHDWYIDFYNMTVEIDDVKTPPNKTEYGDYYDPNIFNDYIDYKNWIKLAKYLKGYTHIATVEYDGKIEEIPVIEMYNCTTYGGEIKIDKIYHKADEFRDWWYIIPEYISNIKQK